ncbi:unnamed protein product [Lymnaea stagnalis]|uniref:Retinol dehydrogenase 7 n=1 Tax=Lymnaea stagnalis TaxID=6523 RepID=A0AAV2HTF2_LYMST
MFWSVIILSVVFVMTYSIFNWIISRLKISKFHEKYILITGCDSGFGQALSMRLDYLGFHVFAGCLTKDGCTYLSERASGRLFPFLMDVTKSESIEQALKIVKEKLPIDRGLWGLVNNAGVARMMGNLEFCTMEDYQKVLNVNLFGLIEVTRIFLPLIRRAHGRIVNMSSVSGRIAVAGGPYCCSKYGVEAFSDILRQEVYSQNIRVSIIEPGNFKTNIVDVDTMVEEMKRAYERASPEVQSVYGNDYVDSFRGLITEVKSTGSPDINPVLDDITHALTARVPYTRYIPGNDVKYILVPLSYLPDWIVDWVMRTIKTRRSQIEKNKST